MTAGSTINPRAGYAGWVAPLCWSAVALEGFDLVVLGVVDVLVSRQQRHVLLLIVVTVIVLMALLAPFVAPQDPYDQGTLDLFDARLSPARSVRAAMSTGSAPMPPDAIYSPPILYGLRTSLIVGVLAGAWRWSSARRSAWSRPITAAASRR